MGTVGLLRPSQTLKLERSEDDEEILQRMRSTEKHRPLPSFFNTIDNRTNNVFGDDALKESDIDVIVDNNSKPAKPMPDLLLNVNTVSFNHLDVLQAEPDNDFKD